MEWEIIGDLGIRLNHKEEAKEAYQRCLDSMRFSQKPWLKLLEMYSEEGDLQRSLQAAIRVAAYQYADYGEMTVSFWMTPDHGWGLTYFEPPVPHNHRPVSGQIGPNPRARKDFVHAHQYGPS